MNINVMLLSNSYRLSRTNLCNNMYTHMYTHMYILYVYCIYIVTQAPSSLSILTTKKNSPEKVEYKQLGFIFIKRSGSVLINFMNIILCKKNLARSISPG